MRSNVMKKKKALSVIAAVAAAVSLTACQETVKGGVQARTGCAEGCTCTDCICCENNSSSDAAYEAPSEETQTETIQTENEQVEITQEESLTSEESEIEDETDEVTEAQSESYEEQTDEIWKLTEGEKAARRQQQINFNEARELLYTLENSKDKTERIVQMDKQILANNSYDFSGKNVVFIGDSITEGITSAIDQNGNFVSYVTYANSYLHFQNVLNHGKGGRMFSTYGGDELSLAENFGNVTNIDSDIIVVFAGINDYLTVVPDKRFGDIYNKESTAGFCGAVRYFMKELKLYYADNDIFFVTMYNVSKTAECQFSDYDGQPDLGDYMDAERKLAEEYGFHVIELYDTGFMDCSSKEASDYYLRDGLHPKDNGNIALGAHIAAELSMYFSQNEHE